MTNEQMFTAIMGRLDSMESGLNKRLDNLETRVDNLESRFNKMESDMDMEFKAVRTEMDVAYKMLKQDISVLNGKFDRLMYTKDVDGYEKMKIQVDLLTRGYQELKEKIG
ncbi:MAG: hypothetical protein NC416_12440 [Eubacterium sp.]|nr:hypothetical protein [Eubacterium sp.]